MPLGFVPLKTDSDEPYGLAGASTGKDAGACSLRSAAPGGQEGSARQRAGNSAGGRIVEGQIDPADGNIGTAVGHQDGALARGRDEQQPDIVRESVAQPAYADVHVRSTEEPRSGTSISDG